MMTSKVVVLGWFVVTVLRGDRRRFAFGTLVSAFIVIGGLDVANPDTLIVRTNAHYGHLEFDTPLDARPLSSFSADATPAIVDALPLLSAQGQRAVVAELNGRYGSQVSASDDWRTFNWSRSQARAALGQIQ